MNDEVVLYIPKSELKEAAGKTALKTILDALCKDGLLKTYKEVMELHVDKAKYIHIQTYLEFHGIQKQGIITNKPPKKEDQ